MDTANYGAPNAITQVDCLSLQSSYTYTLVLVTLMPASDRTLDFRKVVEEKENGLSDAKRRKIVRTSRNDVGRDGRAQLGKDYIAEAYIIVSILLHGIAKLLYELNNASIQLNHIDTLIRMLASIRKPYLNVDSRNTPLSRNTSRNINLDDTDSSWANIRHLTNEERDQIDLQARVILTRCADRVKEMEVLEKREDHSPAAP